MSNILQYIFAEHWTLENISRPFHSNKKMDLDELEPIEESIDHIKKEHQSVLDEFSRKRLARTLAVPTDDLKVRLKLRYLGLPITLFGEGPGDRRNRLKEYVSQRLMEGEQVLDESDESQAEESDSDESMAEEFFTYGSDELAKARRSILAYSLPKAKQRIQKQTNELQIPFAQRKQQRHGLYSYLRTFETHSLQIGDERPMGFCCFSPDSSVLATASWSGLVKLWSVSDSALVVSLSGHKDRVSGIAFHPQGALLASSGVDGSVNLWRDNKLSGSLDGHEMRVARLAFHPSGRWIGTASFDCTWRLWDVATQQELLLQEGHSREVFAIGFQCDGSLVATAGMDSIGRVWDLRTGRSVMVLKGHVKPIIALDWSGNGFQLATGSEDNSIRIWDIRAASILYTVAAHKNIVTQVKYASDGACLVSSSYDGTCKIWTDGDYKPVKTLSGLEGKVMCADASPDGKYIATSSYDRTFKLYCSDPNSLQK